MANREEIASRVIRTYCEPGITTLASCFDVDKQSIHVQFADEAICLVVDQHRKVSCEPIASFGTSELRKVDVIHLSQ
jgi:acetyl-CoA carboxylase biotin carboxylase subunit